MSPNERLTYIDNGAARAQVPGCQRDNCGSDQFEEQEEGTGIASDEVKVECEDLATPGCPSEDRVRRHAGDSE